MEANTLPWRADVIQDFARSELFERTFLEGMDLVANIETFEQLCIRPGDPGGILIQVHHAPGQIEAQIELVGNDDIAVVTQRRS